MPTNFLFGPVKLQLMKLCRESGRPKTITRLGDIQAVRRWSQCQGGDLSSGRFRAGNIFVMMSTIHLFEKLAMNLATFPLVWRWTQSSHLALPVQVLGEL